MTSASDRPPLYIRSPSMATLADSVKNSPRRMTSQIAADPLAPSTSSIHNLSSPTMREQSRSSVEPKPKPKKKKKGWKGWALVIEDDDGNVLEVRDGGDMPDEEEKVDEQGRGEVEMEGSARSRSREPSEAISDTIEAVPVDQPAPLRRDSAPNMTKKDSPGPRHKPNVHIDNTSPRSLTPLSSPERESSPVREDSITLKSDPLPSKRQRKVSPRDSLTPAPELPVTAQPVSKSVPVSKSKPLAGPSQPTRSGTAAARQEARQIQHTASPNPVSPPRPADELLPRIPRAGMGELYPALPESDIRSEAAFIINAAKRRREEDSKRDERSSTLSGEPDGFTPPPTSRPRTAQSNGTRSTRNNSRVPPDLAPHANGSAEYPSPRSANQLPHRNGRSSVDRSHGQSSSRHSNPGPALPPIPHASSRSDPDRPLSPPWPAANGQSSNPHRYPKGSFEADFAEIEAAYQRGANATAVSKAIAGHAVSAALIAPQDIALGRGSSDMIPPRFHEGQKPAIVLANPGHRPRVKDKFEKEYQDGFEGLTPQHIRDCDGFVGNVRDNLRSIISYFFPEPAPCRDAFAERIGRGLIDLGWALTDRGDLAVLSEPVTHSRRHPTGQYQEQQHSQQHRQGQNHQVPNPIHQSNGHGNGQNNRFRVDGAVQGNSWI